MDGQLPTFRVGLFAPTGLYFPPDENLTIRYFPSEAGPIDLEYQTERVLFEGFENPIRLGLRISVQGQASSISEAVEIYSHVAGAMTSILSVAANTANEEPTADVAIETTLTSDQREYWERDGPRVKIPTELRRWIRPMLIQTLVEAYARCPPKKQDRLLRSMIQYHHAIQNWEPGSEIAALSYVWMGVEVITKLIRSKRMEELEFSLEQLREHYSTVLSTELGRRVELIGLNDLDAELRKRYIFKGDVEVYDFARNASDAYEHSFLPLWEVRDRALQALEKAAGYLRDAILEFAEIDPSAVSDLRNEYYLLPYHSSSQITVEGELRGSADDLYQLDDYPLVEWESLPIQRGVDSQGDALVGFAGSVVAPPLPEGVCFQLTQYGIQVSSGAAADVGILSGTNRTAIEGDLLATPGVPVNDRGREVVGFRIRDAFDRRVNTDGMNVFSFDPFKEYRTENVVASEGIGQEAIIRSAEGLQARRAAEGWNLLCAIPVSSERELSLVFERPKDSNQGATA